VAIACWWSPYNQPGSWLPGATPGQNGRFAASGGGLGAPLGPRPARPTPWPTMEHLEKVRSQFLSLRQITRACGFSGRTRSQLSPVTVPVSRLSYGPPIGRVGLLFSERPVSLRSSGLRRFDTVLEIPTFRVSYELQRKGVLRVLSNRRERPISNSPYRGSNPPAPVNQCGA
jgi:hypothetical protein